MKILAILLISCIGFASDPVSKNKIELIYPRKELVLNPKIILKSSGWSEVELLSFKYYLVNKNKKVEKKYKKIPLLFKNLDEYENFKFLTFNVEKEVILLGNRYFIDVYNQKGENIKRFSSGDKKVLSVFETRELVAVQKQSKSIKAPTLDSKHLRHFMISNASKKIKENERLKEKLEKEINKRIGAKALFCNVRNEFGQSETKFHMKLPEGQTVKLIVDYNRDSKIYYINESSLRGRYLTTYGDIFKPYQKYKVRIQAMDDHHNTSSFTGQFTIDCETTHYSFLMKRRKKFKF
ncbi:MAG: hypothetical protein CME70_23640 [Halobacteriovorax sp.]|nr:hypothetical protein [Halobacteriovorax sp.]|tara:strand:+ start:172236 stop:173117 length:882 start_codon:yes stop_codon:yes gene_type:complete